jgi:hypothetical protein
MPAPSDEAIFHLARQPPERLRVHDARCDQQRSSVMWDYLFSVLYRLSCRTTLNEIGLHRLAR